MKRIDTWLTELLLDRWADAVQELLDAGFDVPITAAPIAREAADKRSTGSVKHKVRVKVYRSGDLQSTPVSWGDRDRDRIVAYNIDLQAGGARAVDAMHSAELVVDRILLMTRDSPEASWQRFDSWRSTTAQDYADYQHVVFTVQLSRRGEVVPQPIGDRS